jgi:phosphatidylserine decarboxylase
MRIPLTKYGLPQAAVFPLIIIAAMIVCLLLPAAALITAEVILAVLLIWVLSFFRDPQRIPPAEENLLLAPADGTIRDIEIVDENNFIGGKSLRIGIFLSIFNVHINRSPCNVKVEKIIYKKGSYKDARNPLAGTVNESNDLWLIRTDEPRDKLIVRQISGAIARRIVCETEENQYLAGGEKFGMIKFGSRTELYLPQRKDANLLVKVGDKVKAGLSPVVRYEKCQD